MFLYNFGLDKLIKFYFSCSINGLSLNIKKNRVLHSKEDINTKSSFETITQEKHTKDTFTLLFYASQ